MENQTPQTSTEGMTEDTKTILTVLLLLAVPPVGIIVMWFLPRWKIWVKSLVTGCTCLPFIVFFAFLIIGITIAESDNSSDSNRSRSQTSYDSVNIQGDKFVTTTNNDITIFNDINAGYAVTYSNDDVVSCDNDKYKRELILWKPPYVCSGAGDIPYLIKISRDKTEDQYFPVSSLLDKEEITLDGRLATRYMYKFTENDGPLYGLGGATVILAESPTLDYLGEAQIIRIEMLSDDANDQVILNKLLASFRWSDKE